MSNKQIKSWILQVSNGKTVLVANKVKSIHPVVDRIVRNLLEIDIIKYLRVDSDFIQASNEMEIKGRIKIPVTKQDHPTAVGVSLLMLYSINTVQFYEMNSTIKGYGEKMVQAVLKSFPEDWDLIVVMDSSGGFWDRMVEKYEKIRFF